MISKTATYLQGIFQSLETTLLPNVTFFCILFGSVVFEEVNNRKTVVFEAGKYACRVFGEECDLFCAVIQSISYNFFVYLVVLKDCFVTNSCPLCQFYFLCKQCLCGLRWIWIPCNTQSICVQLYFCFCFATCRMVWLL